MRFPALAAGLAIGLSAAPALAAETAPIPNPTVLMNPVALPVVVDGRLVNYVFVTVRLSISAKADPPTMRRLEPFFRDALVKDAHRNPFVRPDNYAALDDNRLKAVLIRDANAIAGPGMVTSALITREQPMHIDGLPKTKVAPLPSGSPQK